MPYPTLGGSGALELQPVGIKKYIDLLSCPSNQSLDAWSLSMQTSPGGYYGFGFAYNAGGAQNHYFDWKVILAAGTWALEYYYAKGPSSGIATATLDPPGAAPATGQALFTTDQYAAASAFATYQRTTGIVIGSSGTHTVRMSCVSKNAASTGYYLIYQRLTWTRTA